MADTIYASASPPGKGGVGVVRVSGEAALQSLSRICGLGGPSPRHAYFRKFCDPVSRETIDRGLVIFFKAPHSFTGEDVVEFHVHGGVAVVRSLLAALSREAGHRLAEPGEFTRRAFENGKLDLTAAEAVADLIDAETAMQKTQALGQLEGGLSALYGDWAEALTKALAHLEADIEFPDEDMPEGVAPQITGAVEKMVDELGAHLDDGRRGERLRDGIRVAVIGAPNAGKSSLVNALAKRDVAIVSDMAGTTRDIIEVHLDLGGYPVILADTAGLRPDQLSDAGQDAVESEGIRRALDWAQGADLKLLLFDSAALPVRDSHTEALIDGRALVVYSKADKIAEKSLDDGVYLSVESGEGLEDFFAVLAARVEALIGSSETPSLTRERHRLALTEARDALVRSLGADLPELMAEDIRLAVRALGRITGRVDVEDLLDVIFKDFCIGK